MSAGEKSRDGRESTGAGSVGSAMTTKTTSEPLTDSMIRTIRDEAAAAGDNLMVDSCDMALASHGPVHVGRQACTEAINGARAMDNSKPFVRVVA